MAEKIKCLRCGERIINKTNCYQSKSDINIDGRMVICKSCIVDLYNYYYEKVMDERISVLLVCRKVDAPYFEGVFDMAESSRKKINDNAKLEKKEGFVENPVITYYFQKLGSIAEKNGFIGNTFDDGETEIDIEGDRAGFKTNPFFSKDYKFTEKDKETKSDVVNILGYDPFTGRTPFDQRFLYAELIMHLDEDTLDDSFKLSQIIQIVTNNHQIRKLDILIDELSKDSQNMTKNITEIKGLQEAKKKIVESTDKIAKENAISVKNRGDRKAGRSTLTYLMREARELNFDEAEEDFYDQKKALGMSRVAEISNKSIASQLQFDENDYTNMIQKQRDIIEKISNEKIELEEQLRLIHVGDKK